VERERGRGGLHFRGGGAEKRREEKGEGKAGADDAERGKQAG
jgi:hypothetical protein